MKNSNAFELLPFPVILCDPDAIITFMNAAAVVRHAKDGGRALIGSNLLDCHPSPAREELQRLMRERKSNTYTAEKNGAKRLVYQFPVYEDGEYAGYGEIHFDVPNVIPNILRR